MKIKSQKATRAQTKQHNQQLILRTVYRQEPISRADVARQTGLTRPTVSSAVADLIEAGLVFEDGVAPSAGGKPPTLLKLAPNSQQLIGLDLANSNLQGIVANLRGDIQHRVSLPLNGKQGEDVLALVFQLIDSLITRADKPLLGIGIGTPGIVDTRQGIVKEAVNLGWKNLPLRQILAERYDLPVHIANDSHTAALAEYTFVYDHNTANLLVLKVGRGISAGIIINGNLFYGDGFGAGEIGHTVVVDNGELCTCGNHGCLETVASSRAILKEAQAIATARPNSSLNALVSNPADLSIDLLLQATQNGDTEIVPAVNRAGRYLAVSVANLIGALNIQQIIISGSLARFEDLLLEPLQQELQNRALPSSVNATTIKTASLGTDIVLLGATALLLWQELGLV